MNVQRKSFESVVYCGVSGLEWFLKVKMQRKSKKFPYLFYQHPLLKQRILKSSLYSELFSILLFQLLWIAKWDYWLFPILDFPTVPITLHLTCNNNSCLELKGNMEYLGKNILHRLQERKKRWSQWYICICSCKFLLKKNELYFSVGLILVDCFILGFGCCFRGFFNVMLLSNLLKVSMVKPGVCWHKRIKRLMIFK